MMTIVVAALTLVGETVGIAIVFNAPLERILPGIWDFEAGIRPGWQVLGAGLCVVVLDFVRSRASRRVEARRAVA
jgi:sulfoxide reductase heme-binding subunit YedZ